MLDWNLIKKLVLPANPKFPNSREASFEELLPDGLTMGTLYIGRQGTGKTSSLARHLVEYFKSYPDRAIFVLDWSGSITDSILSLVASDRDFEYLVRRIVYDELGNPDLIVPLPEFSHLYGSAYEEQVQRVSQNLAKLAPELIHDAPFLAGLGIREIGPQLFRVIVSASNEANETWQVTEAKKLLTDTKVLNRLLYTYGYKIPETNWFFQNIFLQLKPAERELRSYALLAMLGTIETPETRARVGFSRPGWTPREAIRNGLMVLVNGSRLINQKNTQHYLFTQAYSLIMSEINKRTPANPADKPVALVMDEVYSLLSIPGMAEEIGTLSPLYRSRKLELYIVLQSLSQLAPALQKQIWSIGNIVSFALSNFQEAYELAQQLFAYDPRIVKMAAKSESGQPIIEPDRGQYLQSANELQRMTHRECVVRRYTSERVQDKYVRWIRKTKDVLISPSGVTVDGLKSRLLQARGVKVQDALEVINKRTVYRGGSVPRRPPTI